MASSSSLSVLYYWRGVFFCLSLAVIAVDGGPCRLEPGHCSRNTMRMPVYAQWLFAVITSHSVAAAGSHSVPSIMDAGRRRACESSVFTVGNFCAVIGKNPVLGWMEACRQCACFSRFSVCKACWQTPFLEMAHLKVCYYKGLLFHNYIILYFIKLYLFLICHIIYMWKNVKFSIRCKYFVSFFSVYTLQIFWFWF